MELAPQPKGNGDLVSNETHEGRGTVELAPQPKGNGDNVSGVHVVVLGSVELAPQPKGNGDAVLQFLDPLQSFGWSLLRSRKAMVTLRLHARPPFLASGACSAAERQW